MNALMLGKAAAIERGVARAREEFAAAGTGFASDFTRQDAAILNILRACETALDLANILVRDRGLGVPQTARDGFRLLADAALLEPELAARLQRMVAFAISPCTSTRSSTSRSRRRSCGATSMTC